MLFVMEFLEAFSGRARHWTGEETMLRRIQSLEQREGFKKIMRVQTALIDRCTMIDWLIEAAAIQKLLRKVRKHFLQVFMLLSTIESDEALFVS